MDSCRRGRSSGVVTLVNPLEWGEDTGNGGVEFSLLLICLIMEVNDISSKCRT